MDIQTLIVFLIVLAAALFVGNGYGKLLGVTQLRELGELESPILLTCTLCVWRAADAMVEWMLSMGPSLAVGLPALMVTLSILGYFSVRLTWNVGVRIAVLRRRKRRVKTNS